MLDRMMAAGMDVARLNFSHGTYENHALLITNIREAAARAGKTVPIIQDLSGPRMKTETGHQMEPGASQVITEKDLKDLDFGLSQKVEYVCQSFIGSAADVRQLKEEIAKRGGTAKAMAKVERAEALEDIENIVKGSDAVMLGRGDLGQNIPIEQVPFAEALVVHTCNTQSKPVIVATQMLESMVNNPEPTRAEVTDIAYAIILGADAIMLSEESALGKYPAEAVEIMEKVAVEAEKYERDYHPL